ncbi:MAG: hypothetical protein L0220_11360 [Acidobacteria bacterium]|nr:hypothetical protein [Acidobacteriota bacterium]MCI0661663.1 hypothetical protein [Acidobacteriota bacterium]
MAFIFKLLGIMGSLLATIFLIVDGVRGGLLIIATIFSVVKLIIVIAFLALLLYIFYLLLSSKNPHSPNAE